MGVTIQVFDSASPLLARAAASIGNYERPLALAGMVLSRSFVKQFAASGVPVWVPLAASTVARRRKHSSRPLQDTGRLRRSYTAKSSLGSIYELTKLSLTMGSNLPYAAIHQHGGIISRTSKAGSARLRKTKRGQYRFAKASSKSKSLRTVNWQGGTSYTITIPARPLDVLQADKDMIRDIFKRHAMGALKPK